MAHPVAEYRDEVDALKKEIADLTRTVAQLQPAKPAYGHPNAVAPATREPGLPAGTWRDQCGQIRRRSDGSVWCDPAIAADPMAWQIALHNAPIATEAERGGMTEGERRNPGAYEARLAREAERKALADALGDWPRGPTPQQLQHQAVLEQQRRDHLVWKRSQGLPILHPRPGDEDL
jgi:hypothetical protein